jgi:DHA1 family inner membrane transport protein
MASALAPDYHWMLLFRFLSGLPHGAYFGVASLMAASLVPPEKAHAGGGLVMLGLTVATIIGVPLASFLGQSVNWRWGFGVVAVWRCSVRAPWWPALPRMTALRRGQPCANWAPGRGQVWLTLAIGAIGFGGMFCVYTYVASR